MEQPLSLRGTCVLGLEPVQDSTRLLKGRRAYRAALCGLPGSPSRGQQWGHGPITGTGAPAGARAAADGSSPPAPCCSRPCSGTPQRRTTCQATLWTSTGNTFSLVSEHVFLFFFQLRRQEKELGDTSACGLGRCRNRLLANTEESTGTGSPGMLPSISITAERQGAIRGCGAGPQASSFSCSPACSHTFTR